MKPRKNEIRQLRRDNLAWPKTLAPVPEADWPSGIAMAGEGKRIAVYRSREFLVQCFTESERIIRLSVCRTDWDFRRSSWREDISWDDLQRLKAEAGYAGRWAVEVYPSDSEVVNVANMRHLWVLSGAPSFAWRYGVSVDSLKANAKVG